MADERTEEPLFFLRRASRASGGAGQRLDVVRSEVGQRVGLEPAPEICDRVEFGGIGDQGGAAIDAPALPL